MILDYKNDVLDIDKINFEVDIVNNWKSINVYYNEEILEFRTPSMRVPFDVKEYQKTNKTDYTFCLSFENKDQEDPFYEFIKDLEDKIENQIFNKLENKINEKLNEQNQNEINISRENNKYKRKIKDSENYSSNLNVKLMLDDNNEISTTYSKDNEEELINKDNYNILISRQTYLECIIRCTGLWIIDDNIYITFSVISISCN